MERKMHQQDLSIRESFLLKISWVAHKGAGDEMSVKALQFIHQLLPPGTFEVAGREPDIILFMSGGSEKAALSLSEPGHPVLLLSIAGNNAYAAATEVMAWMVENGRFAVLSDASEALQSGLIGKWFTILQGWRSLQGKKAGLIGTVSDWLVASDVPEARFRELFGVQLVQIPWNELPDFRELDPDARLLARFVGSKAPGLADAARVLALLRDVVARYGLSAMAVECFSLVQQRKVTACLALAMLNTEGLAAACEGDLASMAGMMLLKALTGRVPWMANTTRLTKNSLVLSHCTAAFDLVSQVTLPTHFETDSSLAVKGIITASEVTLFRFSGSLGKAFIAEGKVTGDPGLTNACRTQTEIEVPPASLALLREQPLGNHLLMIPGKWGETLRLACHYKGIKNSFQPVFP
jgi:L-fucose isomerase-like protein